MRTGLPARSPTDLINAQEAIDFAEPLLPKSVADAGGVAWASGQDECQWSGVVAVVYLDVDEPIHTFDVFCTRVLHERGHTVGAVHSSNPRSVGW